MMLDGIRVLDLSRVIAGPFCAMLLGDLGADVIKVERPGRGDDLRYLRGGSGMSAPFAACNRNKRGIAVDLQKVEGVKLVFELANLLSLLKVRRHRLAGQSPHFTKGEGRTHDIFHRRSQCDEVSLLHQKSTSPVLNGFRNSSVPSSQNGKTR